MRELSMTKQAIYMREKREANKTPRFCEGCAVELTNPKQAQRYCAPSCRRKNYTWDNDLPCLYCNINERYGAQSWCLACRRAKNHGMESFIDVQIMYVNQEGRCGICGEQLDDQYKVDHDPRCCPSKTGKSCGECVRGLVHSSCNTAIGKLKDSPQILRKAAEYIERHLEK